MTEDEARVAVRATLAVMAALAGSTRTRADNMMVEILHRNEDKLTAAVLDLTRDAAPPTPERVAAVLAAVGIRVTDRPGTDHVK